MKLLIALVVWWYSMDAALLYGGIWDSQANPTEVVVTLPGGGQLAGTMTRDWNRNYVVTAPDGAEARFQAYDSLAYVLMGARPRWPSQSTTRRCEGNRVMNDFLVDLVIQVGAVVMGAAGLVAAVALVTWLVPASQAFF